jgi:hypothetical protein
VDNAEAVECRSLLERVCSLCGAPACLVAWAEGCSVIGACGGAHLVEIRALLARALRFSVAHLSAA